MIHELLQITGSHNVEGTLLIPKDTGSAQTVTGSVAHQNGEIFIFNGQNWQTLGAQTGTTQPDTSLEYIVIAGGGGGGGWGGGGGAGGFLSGSIDTVTSGSTFTMTVGAGSAGGQLSQNAGGYVVGVDGSNSSLVGSGYTTVTTIGGGGGGRHNSYTPDNGRDGGSGGGAGMHAGGGTGAGGSGTAGQGNDGGAGGGSSTYYYRGGGGGGASQVGQDGNGYSAGGEGGSGSLSSITGTAVRYAGGGGSHTDRRGGGGVAPGGPGGGGAGGGYQPDTHAGDGTANTGGGGGGSYGYSNSHQGGGGSGVIIVAYDSGSFNGGGGIVGPGSGSKKSHSFLSSGTFKIGATTDFQIVTDNLKLHLDAGNFSSRGDSTWTDLTSTGYNATLVSSPTLTNFYYEFDGSADYGTFSSTAATDLQNDTQGSIEVWVYGDSFSSGNARKTIFGTGHSSSTSNWVVLRVHNSNGIQMSVWDGSTSRDFQTGSVPSTGAWLHIVATATSDGTGKIYLNGVSQSVTYAGGGSAGDGSSRWFSHSSTNTLQVGALDRGSYGNNYDPWDGRIAQVRYYTDVLTDAEVLQNYNATKTNFS